MLSRQQDAYGFIIEQRAKGIAAPEIIERDDGYVGLSSGAPAYFAPFEEWPAHQRRAMGFVRGRVLDAGVGAGRVSLHLQERGHEVLGIDWSPGAVRVARQRGVPARVMKLTGLTKKLGPFDTVVMMGNNFGLLESERRGRWLLRRLHGLTSEKGRIVAESRDTSAPTVTDHRRYHRLNLERGRMRGQLRMRVRSGSTCTPWFDYLLVSPAEMRRLVRGTGWRVARLLPARGDSMYAAVLEKERA
ncbi:MAG: methyltransferase type 11 [Deltaproteobacteria bacterium]|nr:methyltransferase type 11 [Deltaproteobacteria bacterium]